MENDKCPFCGSEVEERRLFFPGFHHYKCGTTTMMLVQSSHCKLIVANRELDDRHKRLVEAAKEVIDEEEGSTKVWRYIERLRKAVEG